MDVFGLPLHPLIVHAAVVLVPLAAIGALLVLASGWVRTRYGWLTAAAAVAGAAACVAARLSGEALAATMGGGGALVQAHRMWGELAPFPAVALALALPATLLLERRTRGGWWAGLVVTAASSLACLVLVVLTGHSGATAVWGS